MKMSIFATLAKAEHRKYKRLKLGSGQAYDLSTVRTVDIPGQYMSNKHNVLYRT